MNHPRRVLRYEEAGEFVENQPDSRRRDLLRMAMYTAFLGHGMDPAVLPVEDFDLRYYLEAVNAILSNETTLKSIIDGEPVAYRWWE